MDWRMASLLVLGLWGSYMIFGAKATEIHGERVSMFTEGLAMFFIGSLAVLGHFGDFAKMTLRSGSFATIMGLMSGLGLFIQLYALRVAPKDAWPIVSMITGSWPVVTAVLLCILPGGTKLQPQQWAGVGLAAAGLILVNWVR